jgi:hypothetical protein
MPYHPHAITQLSTALLRTISILLGEAAGQGVVVRREAACGIAADKLLTGREASVMRCHGRARDPFGAMYSPRAADLRAAGTLPQLPGLPIVVWIAVTETPVAD